MESLQQKMIWSLRILDSLAIKDRREQDHSLYIFKISTPNFFRWTWSLITVLHSWPSTFPLYLFFSTCHCFLVHLADIWLLYQSWRLFYASQKINNSLHFITTLRWLLSRNAIISCTSSYHMQSIRVGISDKKLTSR